jgi:hypothetical protein
MVERFPYGFGWMQSPRVLGHLAALSFSVVVWALVYRAICV